MKKTMGMILLLFVGLSAQANQKFCGRNSDCPTGQYCFMAWHPDGFTCQPIQPGSQIGEILEFSSTVHNHCTGANLSDTHLEEAKTECGGAIMLVEHTVQMIRGRWGDMNCPLYETSEVYSEYFCIRDR